MRTLSRWDRALFAVGVMSCYGSGLTLAEAQIRPGEDPVILSKRVTNLELPDAGLVKSNPLNNAEMPASMRAKVARYEAKSKSNDGIDFSSDKDVTRETSSDGLKKTCIQEVGSNTAATGAQQPRRAGQANTQQIVVLRGDLVNICK